MPSPTTLPAWTELLAHRAELDGTHMRDLFAAQPTRFDDLSLRLGDLLFDFSKHRITARTMALLVDLANQAGVPQRVERMFAGQRINVTEDRPVLHVALRAPRGTVIEVDGADVVESVHEVRARMRDLCTRIRDGSWIGHTGERITDVINIGIGGSDLGPAMATEALRPLWTGPRVLFVSNVDGSDLSDALEGLRPESTLFVVASKSFTTHETMTNARTARRWLVEALGEDAIARHVIAISTNAAAIAAFGVDPGHALPIWDWVGGRYSMWSAIGLPVAIAVGMDAFEDMLAGARDVDEHFVGAPSRDNIPMVMALLGVWYANFWGAASHAVLPYCQHLHRLPAYLQQADMESNGKGVHRDGSPVLDHATGPIVWGGQGTNGQHAFLQLLHQGTHLVPVDFIAVARGSSPHDDHHRILLANFVAQTQALMRGKLETQVRADLRAGGVEPARIDALAAHRSFPGNRPSSSIVIAELTPRTLGQLIALYEHKIFVQGVIWDVNSFDQWGVELGKQLAASHEPELANGIIAADQDPSTRGLLAHLLALRSGVG